MHNLYISLKSGYANLTGAKSETPGIKPGLLAACCRRQNTQLLKHEFKQLNHPRDPQRLSLLQHQLDRCILQIWRVLVLAQNPLDHQAQLGTHTFTL